MDGWVSYKFWVAHQSEGAVVFKCFKQPWEGLPKARKSGEWTLTQSGASAKTHKSPGSVNPLCATAGFCLLGVRYRICTGELNINTHFVTAHCVFVCVCVCVHILDMMAIFWIFKLCHSVWSQIYCIISCRDYIPRPFSCISAINSLVFHLSGPGCGAGPPGRVFQRGPVLHSRLSHLRGGVHIWRVCSEERGASQEEDGRQPLWSHYWTGPTG